MSAFDLLAANMKFLRNNVGLTQTEIGNKLGVNKTTVMRWESGDTTPDVKTVLWYADYFDVSLDWLFGRKMTIRGDFRKLLVDEVGDAICETVRPGGRVYEELEREINEMVLAYGLREGD